MTGKDKLSGISQGRVKEMPNKKVSMFCGEAEKERITSLKGRYESRLKEQIRFWLMEDGKVPGLKDSVCDRTGVHAPRWSKACVE